MRFYVKWAVIVCVVMSLYVIAIFTVPDKYQIDIALGLVTLVCSFLITVYFGRKGGK